MRQVLTNLVGNAVKFTNEGEVFVSVSAQKNPEDIYEIIFTVKDTGIGIPAEKMDKLFNPFSQVDSYSTRSYGGTGLGLVISRKLVELMNGRMWVESEVGKGTAFYFTIKAEAFQESDNQDESLRNLADKKILIVDDFSTMRRIIKNLLRDLGYNNTQEADDGLTALPMLKGGDFDFLVTDWNMPGMQGIDLLKAVGADAELASLPVLMVTAEQKREQIVEAAEAGVNGYIVKPFTAQTLKEKIDKIFERIEAGG